MCMNIFYPQSSSLEGKSKPNTRRYIRFLWKTWYLQKSLLPCAGLASLFALQPVILVLGDIYPSLSHPPSLGKDHHFNPRLGIHD